MRRTSAYYRNKVEKILGNNLAEFSMECADTKHPVIEISYFDFKPQPIVRAELQMAMPEVDFAKIGRDYTDDVLKFFFIERLFDGDVKIIVDGEQYGIVDYVMSELYDEDCTAWDVRRPNIHESREDENHD